MISAELLDYTFDEEGTGFGEPETPTSPAGLTARAKGALGLSGLGLLALIVQMIGGPGAGTWSGLITSFGLLTAGGVLFFWLDGRGHPVGIRHDGTFFNGLLSRGALGWLAGVLMTGFYVLIYWYPEVLGHPTGDAGPTGLVRVVDPLARAATGSAASQWFLYGVLYSLVICIFGVRMAMKYRHNRYHQIRTASVALSQFVLAWLLPNLLVRFQQPYMEFNGVWPLKDSYLQPGKVGQFADAGAFGWFLLVFALGVVVATPILTYFFGKRWYCSWVCGCGGLAETLGDPWRQLSDNSDRAWKIERYMIHTVLVLVLVTTGALWANHMWGLFGSAYSLKQWYGFYIGAVFSGVVGVGFYPLLGNRVWCRFGCPQAAILGLWQRLFSRFRITTNGGQCMSCGNCSTYCEMGIDVRAYAQRGENIVRASCVGCGVCSAVCPRGVLRLENGSTHMDRFAGAERPLETLSSSIREAAKELPTFGDLQKRIRARFGLKKRR